MPKSFNASYGDLPYEQKLVHYDSQNLLARSLNENAYDHNPGFRRFLEQSGLPFRPHAEFRKADLDDRQELYGQLAELHLEPRAAGPGSRITGCITSLQRKVLVAMSGSRAACTPACVPTWKDASAGN